MRILILAVLGFSASVSADEAPKELDDLVVSASRSPVFRDQSGSSITVIDREQLERRQSVLLLDVLRDVPGVAVSRSGTFGSTAQVRMRGSEANHVLVIIDGVEINDPSQGDAVDFAHLAARNIERIEIIRGPQSALWGSDAVAGVISIVTKEATAPFSVQGFAEAGSFATTHGGFRLSGLDESYSYSANLSYLDTDGTNISRIGDEDDSYDNLTADFKTAISFSDAWSASASLRRTTASTQFDPVDFFTTGLPTDGDRETEISQTYAQIGVQLETQNWVHGWKLSFLDTDNENFADGLTNSRQASESLGFSYQASVTWGDRSLTLAIDHEEDDFIQRGAASPFGDPNQDQTTRSTGYVAEYRAQVVEPLNVSLSVRYDDNSDFDSIVSYRGAASYALSDLTRFKASVGTGQTRPTFTELFGFFPDQFIGNPNLEPERSFAWEIGVEQSFGALTVDLSYFNERLEDEINGFVFDPATFLFTADNQVGTSHREGVEFSLGGDLTDWFTVAASYTYTDSDEPDGVGGSQRELRRPQNRLSLNLNFIPSIRSNLNLNVTHNGEQQDLFFPPFPEPSQRLDLDSYTLVSLSGHFDISDTFRLLARVENLLDEEYEEVFGFRAPGVGVYAGIQFGTQ